MITKIIYKLGQYRWKSSFLAILIIISTLIGLILPYLNGEILDIMVSTKNMSIIFYKVIRILILGVFSIGCNFLITYYQMKLKEIIKYDLRLELINDLRNISIVEFNKKPASYLNQRIEQDLSTAINFIIDNYVAVVINALQFLIMIFIILKIENHLSILILLLILTYYFIYKKFSSPIFKSNMKLREEQNSLYKTFNDQFELMEEIKIESEYNKVDNKLKNSFLKYLQILLDFIIKTNIFHSVDQLFSVFFQACLFMIGGYQVLKNNISIGDLSIISVYFMSLLQCLKYYIEFGKEYQIFKVVISRISELEKIPIEKEGNIELNKIDSIVANITYAYSEKKLIQNIKFSLKRENILIIKGLNGSGKSTLLRVIIGILRSEKNDTNIFFNGIPIKDLKLTTLRKRIGYVAQNIKLTNEEMKSYFNDVNIKEVSEIEYYFEEFLKPLPDNIIKFLENKWNSNMLSLSGGEKQIVTILKMIIKSPDVYIFDEPTSNMDGIFKQYFEILVSELSVKSIIILVTHDDKLNILGDIICV